MITTDEIMACGPCREYPRARVEEMCGSGVTARQVLESDLPRVDRQWVLTNVLSRRDRPALIAWAWRCLARVERDCPAWRAMLAAPGDVALAGAAAITAARTVNDYIAATTAYAASYDASYAAYAAAAAAAAASYAYAAAYYASRAATCVSMISDGDALWRDLADTIDGGGP